MIFTTGSGNTTTAFESAMNIGSTKTNASCNSLTFGIVVIKITRSPVGKKGKCCLLRAYRVAVVMSKWEGSDKYLGQAGMGRNQDKEGKHRICLNICLTPRLWV